MNLRRHQPKTYVPKGQSPRSIPRDDLPKVKEAAARKKALAAEQKAQALQAQDMANTRKQLGTREGLIAAGLLKPRKSGW